MSAAVAFAPIEQLTPEQFALALANPMFRLENLYFIKTKTADDDEDSDGVVVRFKPNRAQRRLLDRLHYKNLILKARQLGFTTLIQILFLDFAMFTPNLNIGVIAHTDDAAKKIFKKIKFAYDRLPQVLREANPLTACSVREMVFKNGSTITVGTSMRGDTIHYLHVSEYGKICAKFPDRAEEVITGTLPAVPDTGMVFIESTAEGRDGDFYSKSKRAEAHHLAGTKLTAKQFRFHFFPWHEEDAYEMDPDGVVISKTEHEYFDRVEGEIGAEISLRKRAWWIATRDETFSGEDERMWQEYPSCVSGEALVSTPDGMVRLKDVVVDGQKIQAKYNKGVKEVFSVTTKLGYNVVCTDDHPILCDDGAYRKLRDIQVGQQVRLARPNLGSRQQFVTYHPNRLASATIDIDEDLARFIGVFMGDGCFHRDSLSIACDAEDADMVQVVYDMVEKYVGSASVRITGSKHGCAEVRSTSNTLRQPFEALELIRQNSSLSFKRDVHVPGYMFQSPPTVVRAFLSGLFETDGFAARDGTSIKLFSKYGDFCRDVQLLLLGLGIESRSSRIMKKGGNGIAYEGRELVLRADGVRKFASEIGFMSRRKQDRAEMSLAKRKTGSNANFAWVDEIVSIEPAGQETVYDITTDTHNFIAGGIVVHNCPAEAFQVSTAGTYYAVQIARARKEKRITQVAYQQGVPVNTYWDIGRGDGTAVWFHQRIGVRDHFIKFIEGWGEPYSHFVSQMQGLGWVWGKHFVPHDGAYVKQGQDYDTQISPVQMLENLGLRNIEVVQRVDELQHGIQKVRDVFGNCWFDAEGCKEGVIHLEMYKKQWNVRTQTWTDTPLKDIHTEGADSFRQFAQGYTESSGQWKRRKSSWRTV